MAKAYKNMSIDELIEKYRQGAIIHSDLSDPKMAKKGHNQAYKSGRILRESQEGREALMNLMEDAEPNVRCWAATQCLQWKPDVARRVLEELRDSPKLDWWISSDADIIMQQYASGQLKFD